MRNALEQNEALRVLVVEDEPLIAWMLEDAVSSLGFEVIGPFPSIKEATLAIEEGKPNIALLDVNLIDGEVFPLADRLDKLDVPLIFHTANVGGNDLASRYSDAKIVSKPSTPVHLQKAIESAKAGLV